MPLSKTEAEAFITTHLFSKLTPSAKKLAKRDMTLGVDFDDLIQETIIALLKAVESKDFPATEDIERFSETVLERKWIDMRRPQKRRLYPLPEADGGAQDRRLPEDAEYSARHCELLRTWLEEPHLFDALLARHGLGHRVKEIAGRWQTSEKTIYNWDRKSRARARCLFRVHPNDNDVQRTLCQWNAQRYQKEKLRLNANSGFAQTCRDIAHLNCGDYFQRRKEHLRKAIDLEVRDYLLRELLSIIELQAEWCWTLGDFVPIRCILSIDRDLFDEQPDELGSRYRYLCATANHACHGTDVVGEYARVRESSSQLPTPLRVQLDECLGRAYAESGETQQTIDHTYAALAVAAPSTSTILKGWARSRPELDISSQADDPKLKPHSLLRAAQNLSYLQEWETAREILASVDCPTSLGHRDKGLFAHLAARVLWNCGEKDEATACAVVAWGLRRWPVVQEHRLAATGNLLMQFAG